MLQIVRQLHPVLGLAELTDEGEGMRSSRSLQGAVRSVQEPRLESQRNECDVFLGQVRIVVVPENERCMTGVSIRVAEAFVGKMEQSKAMLFAPELIEVLFELLRNIRGVTRIDDDGAIHHQGVLCFIDMALMFCISKHIIRQILPLVEPRNPLVRLPDQMDLVIHAWFGMVGARYPTAPRGSFQPPKGVCLLGTFCAP